MLVPWYAWGNNPRTHCVGGLVGPIADLDIMEERKSLLPLPGIEFQLLGHTDWALILISARCNQERKDIFQFGVNLFFWICTMCFKVSQWPVHWQILKQDNYRVIHLAPAPRPSLIYCASPLTSPLLIPHFEWNVGLYLCGHHKSHLVPWRTDPGDEILNEL
jgi:hypothetical protein